MLSLHELRFNSRTFHFGTRGFSSMAFPAIMASAALLFSSLTYIWYVMLSLMYTGCTESSISSTSTYGSIGILSTVSPATYHYLKQATYHNLNGAMESSLMRLYSVKCIIFIDPLRTRNSFIRQNLTSTRGLTLEGKI